MGAPFFRNLERRHEIFGDVFAFSHAALQVRGRSGNEEVEGQFVADSSSALCRHRPYWEDCSLRKTIAPEVGRRAWQW